MKALILTSQRSGSTFLRFCLDAHPTIECHGELLIGGNVPQPALIRGRRMLTKAYRYLAIRGWNPVGVIERYYAQAQARAPIAAFTGMYNHVDSRRVREYLVQHSDIRVIHLRRDNLLKQHVSKLLLGAKRERAWQPHTEHRIPVVSVRVAPAKAIRDMRRVRDSFTEFERLLAGHRKIELVYERMVNGQTLSDEAWEKIGGLLEITPSGTGSKLVKMNPDQLRPMVDNYDELAAALAGTEFERHLD